MEQHTGQSPQRVEAHRGPCGFRLCMAWFYYDAHDRLIDADLSGSAD